MSLATERRPKAATKLPTAAKRYRKGKLPEGIAAAADSDDSGAEEQDEDEGEAEDVPFDGLSGDEDEDIPLPTARNISAPKKMNLALRDVAISREGKVVIAGKHEAGRTGVELGQSILAPQLLSNNTYAQTKKVTRKTMTLQ